MGVFDITNNINDLFPIEMFSEPQKYELELAKKTGKDITLMYNPLFSSLAMLYIRKGLEAGYDISLYANTDLSTDQIRILYLGFYYGIDAAVIAKFNKPEFGASLMSAIVDGVRSGCKPCDLYINPKLSPDKVDLIVYGIKQGIDVTWYNKPEFNCEQMAAIISALTLKLDISEFAKPDVSADTMWEHINKDKEFIRIYSGPKTKQSRKFELYQEISYEIDNPLDSSRKSFREQLCAK